MPSMRSTTVAALVHRRHRRARGRRAAGRHRNTTSSSAAAPSTTAPAPPDGAPTSASAATASPRSATSTGATAAHDRRRDGPRGRARLHQHAVVVHRVAARRRPLAGRHPPGRHDGDLRRGQLDGPAQRRDEEARASSRWATSSTTSPGRRSSEYLKDLERRGVSPNVASFIGATTIREHVIGLEDKKPTPRAARRDARARAAGDGGGRARHRLVADLRAGLLRLDRGADRALQGRGAVSRQVHLAHAQRGQPSARGGRRADPHQPRGRASRPRSITSRPPARRTGRRWTR